MRRRQFIKQTAATLVAQHAVRVQEEAAPREAGVNASEGGQSGAKDSRRPRGEWPLPGQNNRYLAQAELPCKMPRALKELGIDQERGRLLREVGIPAAHGPVVADVDGDGICEIVVGCKDGKLRAYK